MFSIEPTSISSSSCIMDTLAGGKHHKSSHFHWASLSSMIPEYNEVTAFLVDDTALTDWGWYCIQVDPLLGVQAKWLRYVCAWWWLGVQFPKQGELWYLVMYPVLHDGWGSSELFGVVENFRYVLTHVPSKHDNGVVKSSVNAIWLSSVVLQVP